MTSLAVKPKDLAFPADFKLYGGSSGTGKPKSDYTADADVKKPLISKNLKVEVVSQQTKAAPKPPKQPKYIVNRVSSHSMQNDLSRIVSEVSRGQRTNIDHFTKGHLNERHLNAMVPPQLGDIEPKWGDKYSKPLPPKNTKKVNKRPSRSSNDYKNMGHALQEFVMRTAGANNLLSTVFEDEEKQTSRSSKPTTSSAKPRNEKSDELEITELEDNASPRNDEVPETDRKSYTSDEDLGIYEAENSTIRDASVVHYPKPNLGSRWNLSPQIEELQPGELKLPKIEVYKKPSHSPTPPGTPGEGMSKFLTSHFYGATKKDQFSGLTRFQGRVMNFDTHEVKVVSNSMAAKYYKDKLKKLLTSLPSRTMRSPSPNLEKVFAHGRVWDDLIKDSPIFGPVLTVIKNEYDNYLRHLAVNERRKLESGSLESEVTGLLTAGTFLPMPAHSAEAANSRGGVNSLDGGSGDVIEEEELRNSEMENEIEMILQDNKDLHEQIKSLKRRVEAKKEIRRQSLLGEPPTSSEGSDGQIGLHQEDEQNIPSGGVSKMSRAELLLGLKEEIVASMESIDSIRQEMKHDMVPKALTHSIKQLAQQDQKKIERYGELCERVIETSTEVGKEFNDHLSKAVISPIEIKMLWRKLKTMNVAGKYVLTSERPTMSSEGTVVIPESTNQKLEEAVNISQSDIEAVNVEQQFEDQISQSAPAAFEARPESSKREDFDFYF